CPGCCSGSRRCGLATTSTNCRWRRSGWGARRCRGTCWCWRCSRSPACCSRLGGCGGTGEVASRRGPRLPPPLVPARTRFRGGGFAALREVAVARRGAPVVVGLAVHHPGLRFRGLQRTVVRADAAVLPGVPAAVCARAAGTATARHALRAGHGAAEPGAAALVPGRAELFRVRLRDAAHHRTHAAVALPAGGGRAQRGAGRGGGLAR